LAIPRSFLLKRMRIVHNLIIPLHQPKNPYGLHRVSLQSQWDARVSLPGANLLTAAHALCRAAAVSITRARSVSSGILNILVERNSFTRVWKIVIRDNRCCAPACNSVRSTDTACIQQTRRQPFTFSQSPPAPSATWTVRIAFFWQKSTSIRTAGFAWLTRYSNRI